MDRDSETRRGGGMGSGPGIDTDSGHTGGLGTDVGQDDEEVPEE